jgi:hypothetical protein
VEACSGMLLQVEIGNNMMLMVTMQIIIVVDGLSSSFTPTLSQELQIT